MGDRGVDRAEVERRRDLDRRMRETMAFLAWAYQLADWLAEPMQPGQTEERQIRVGATGQRLIVAKRPVPR